MKLTITSFMAAVAAFWSTAILAGTPVEGEKSGVVPPSEPQPVK